MLATENGGIVPGGWIEIPGPGNPSAAGSHRASVSAVATSGRDVTIAPGSAASVNDQPSPTARSGKLLASASRTAAPTSSTEVGKHIVLATYACVLVQFCQKWFMLVNNERLASDDRCAQVGRVGPGGLGGGAGRGAGWGRGG